MPITAGDGTGTSVDPPITIQDLIDDYKAKVDSNTGNVTVSIGNTPYSFNLRNPNYFIKDGTINNGASVFDAIQIALNIDEGRIAFSVTSDVIPEVVEKKIVKPEPEIFTYKDASSAQEYENTYKAQTGADQNQPDTIQEKDTTSSLFNKWSLLKYRGTPLNNTSNKLSDVENEYRKIKLDQDLIGVKSPNTFALINKLKEVAPDSYAYQYDFSDFALAKYNNKIPNNRLITLRRFAGPVEDDIITQERIGKTKDGKKDTFALNFPPIAQAVTWFDEATGNNLNEILKFNYGLNFTPIESKIQEIQRTGEGEQSGLLNSLAQKLPLGVKGFLTGRNAVDQARIEAEGDSFDPLTSTYPNYVLGPYNVIKDMEVRDSGLKFEHEFKLIFEYKIRYFPGVNPKVLFLDQFANILSLTYNTAPFWGGAVRYTGGNSQIIPPLGNLQDLADGKPGKFLKGVFEDATNIFKSRFNNSGGFSFQDAFNDLKGGKIPNLGPLVTNLIGGKLMEYVNTPQAGQTIKALLTGEATGQWHVTVGNPLNPIAMVGNLICTGTDIEFGNTMGLQDFPDDIKVTISLKPGRPRDKADIESMFNCGRGRLYIEPNDGFSNGLDVAADKGSPLKKSQIKMLKRMNNG